MIEKLKEIGCRVAGLSWLSWLTVASLTTRSGKQKTTGCRGCRVVMVNGRQSHTKPTTKTTRSGQQKQRVAMVNGRQSPSRPFALLPNTHPCPSREGNQLPPVIFNLCNLPTVIFNCEICGLIFFTSGEFSIREIGVIYLR